jgi:hypothetical protein
MKRLVRLGTRRLLSKLAGPSVAAVVVGTTFASQPVPSEQGVCNPRVKASASPNGYRWRDDRCEGLYAETVATQPLWLSGLQCQNISFSNDLSLAWPSPPTSATSVEVRAVSVNPDVLYRMDRLQRVSNTQYNWSSGLRRAVGLAGSEVAVFAVTPPLAETGPHLYLPIRTHATECSLEAVLQTSVELRDIRVGVNNLKRRDSPVTHEACLDNAVHLVVPRGRP